MPASKDAPVGWSVRSPCGSYMVVTVGIKPLCGADLAVLGVRMYGSPCRYSEMHVLMDLRDCGMISGMSALESGSYGAQGPGNKSYAGGTCPESQKKPFSCHQSSSVSYAAFRG